MCHIDTYFKYIYVRGTCTCDIYAQYMPLNESELISSEEYDESSVSYCNSIENEPYIFLNIV